MQESGRESESQEMTLPWSRDVVASVSCGPLTAAVPRDNEERVLWSLSRERGVGDAVNNTIVPLSA